MNNYVHDASGSLSEQPALRAASGRDIIRFLGNVSIDAIL